MPDIRQSRQYADYLSQIGWTVERINNTNYFVKKIPLIGSVLKIQRPKEINFEEIERLRKKYRAFQTIIEPQLTTSLRSILHDSLYTHGYRLCKSPYLPTITLHLELSMSKQKLYEYLEKDAKYAIKRTLNIQINTTENIELFREIWKQAVGYKRYIPPLSHLIYLKKSFKDNCLFLISEEFASGAIFLSCGKNAYYWQAFTGKEGRKSQVQYAIVWKGILWAKKKGAKIFDFEGIYDQRFPNKSWLGFTHFKKSFGGYEVEYPGCYTKWNSPL